MRLNVNQEKIVISEPAYTASAELTIGNLIKFRLQKPEKNN